MGGSTPLEPGWTVRLVATGFTRLYNGVAYDPVSTDLFVADEGARTLYRVTQNGVKTAIHSDPDFAMDELAFDTVHRVVYLGGNLQDVLRKVAEDGTFLGDVTTPLRYTGLAMAPDGNLYLVGWYVPSMWRYDVGNGTFTEVHTNLGGNLEGLAFDPAGNAYVAVMSADAVLKVTPAGVRTTIATLVNPVGVSFGDGSVFVATSCSGNIYRIAPDGSGTTNFAIGQYCTIGIHFGSDGRVYLNDGYYFPGDGGLWEYSPGVVPVESHSWGAVKSRYR